MLLIHRFIRILWAQRADNVAGRSLSLGMSFCMLAGVRMYVCMYVLVPVVNVLADMHLLPSYCCCRAAAPEIRVRSELI